jgi:hypothetical protein
MIVKIKGTVTSAGEKKSGVSQTTGNPWASQDFVITEENNNILNVQVFGEDSIARFAIGQLVEFNATLSSKEWNGRYYTSLRYLPPKEEYTSTVQTQYVQQPKTVAQTSNNSDSDAFPF